MTLMDAPMTGEISLAELFGFEVDKTQDIAEIIFAAKKGEKDAMGVLGEKFLKGIDVKKSIPKALYWLRESDDERAWNSIASFYEKDGDYDRAIEWYLKVVEKDGPYSYQGMNSLCLLYLLPEKLNIEEAEYYLVKSLEAMENIPDRLKEKNGYMEYQNTLLYGAAGVLGFYYSKINPERAVFWLTEDQMNRVTERTAEEQKMFAKALAESYNQLFFLPDISEELLDEAAEMIEPLAEKIGAPYSYGMSEYYTNKREETEKYFYWKEKAANQGDITSQVQLAMAYLGEEHIPEFKGVSADTEKCRYYLEMARCNTKASTETPEKYDQLMKVCDQAEEFIVKEEDKFQKHFTSKEAQQLINGNSFAYVGIPEGYTHVDKMAFSGIQDKKALKLCKEVRFPDSLHVIETQAFYEVYNIEKITLPKSLRVLAAGAFDSYDYVMKGGFKMLFAPTRKPLEKLIVPARTKLEEIRKEKEVYTAFTGIYRIDHLVFEEGRAEISWNLFNDISIKDLYVPDSVQKMTFDDFGEYKFKVERISLPERLKSDIPEKIASSDTKCQFMYRK